MDEKRVQIEITGGPVAHVDGKRFEGMDAIVLLTFAKIAQGARTGWKPVQS